MTGKFEVKEVVDLDELVGLLSYVMEGVELAPHKEVPWGGISRLVKDINLRTSRLRYQAMAVPPEERPEPSRIQERATERAPEKSVVAEKISATEPQLETEVDSGLQASQLARRIQMAPRVGSGKVREVPLTR